MCKKDTIANLLIYKSGNLLLPKSDGEIEVPLQIKTKKEMGIGVGHGEILISSNDLFDTKISSSKGKIIIPRALLKQAGLENKTLAFINSIDLIILRADNVHLDGYVKSVVNMFNQEQVDALYDLLLGNTPNIKISTELERPVLFELNDEEFIFRSIGFPVSFTKEKSKFFLIPGINKSTKESGYLLLREATYARVIYVLKLNNLAGEEDINRDMIFCYVPFLEGGYKVFISPPEYIFKEEIIKAKKICNNPEKFIEEILKNE